ncbi:hypothetical protein F5880DRAFT_1512022 [Lentinula raphanica]|nr:hypothetical protein F5880DRAFT_1512022 [Lentinula raphanica]
MRLSAVLLLGFVSTTYGLPRPAVCFQHRQIELFTYPNRKYIDALPPHDSKSQQTAHHEQGAVHTQPDLAGELSVHTQPEHSREVAAHTQQAPAGNAESSKKDVKRPRRSVQRFVCKETHQAALFLDAMTNLFGSVVVAKHGHNWSSAVRSGGLSWFSYAFWFF